MQMRENDIMLNECPKSMTEHPTEEHHSLFVTLDTHKQLRIPLRLRGVTSTIYVHTPTPEEYQQLLQVDLTNQDLAWNPQYPDYSEQEDHFLITFGEFNPTGDKFLGPNRSAWMQIYSVGALNSLQEAVHMNSYSDAMLNSIEPTLNN